MNLFALNSI